MDNNYVYKIIFVGDSGVGKSTLLERYINNNFASTHNMTIGVDFKSKKLCINNKNIQLQLWDTAGQETFRNLVISYYRHADCVIIFFDITNKESFNNVDFWYNEAQKHKSRDILIVVIGTKKDLKNDRKVYITDIKKYMSDKNFRYFETSSKLNDGIVYIFDYIAEILSEKIIDIKKCEITIQHSININNNLKKEKSVLLKKNNFKINKKCCK
jgi:small GTP-binding protein